MLKNAWGQQTQLSKKPPNYGFIPLRGSEEDGQRFPIFNQSKAWGQS
jgi:hypothetical protein